MTAATRTSGGLTARLGLVSLVVFGLSYMAPAIVVSTFGVIASTSSGVAPTAYLVATVAMTLTALSYGKLARDHPVSGSVYTYARRLLGPRTGFLAGWALLLDYLFLPMVAWLIQALYLHVQFPAVPAWGWLVVVIALTTVVNALGLVIADRVNKVLLGLTALGLLALAVVCVVAIGGRPASDGAHALWHPGVSPGAVTAAAAVAAYSFLGFDAISTLSEEVRDARRNVPRGIVLTVLIGGGVFFVISLLLQWVHPGASFRDESTAGFEVAALAGGRHFADVTNAIGLIGGLASCVAIQASTSRLMYVMGRDGVLPRRVCGRLNARLGTPVLNLLVIAVVGLLGTCLSLDTATSFINFGAFLAFTVVNICVIAAWLRHRRAGARRSVLAHVIVPALGAVADVYLLTKLNHLALLLGGAWLVVGVVHLCVLTGGLRREPPELHLTETEEPVGAST
ncbi:APC family permease [Streptomyces thermodiastaticus]|jgi:amino acid transporter|uniref:APC family permease n=1 Tax=Streptomyces thermodiastaticus TaxID=44061 RepID=UPI001675537C|nr:APC family permease [Streptomyces thermodiastaticus]MCE7553319.1 APC family permease [Streptomyces thermodiastaticus]GHF96124.1 amino acid permease [Streptomyces thermodiastaticus]